MLSISGAIKGVGQGDYYLSLAREDYYLEGGEPPGEWIGEGAKLLGLNGQVDDLALRNLMGGKDITGTELVQNAGDPNRRSAFDLTFSADKSVSVFWALSPRNEQKTIELAHKEAVKKVIGFLEEYGVKTRRGKGGNTKENGKLIAATFLHSTNRNGEPHLHTHSLFLNIVVRNDGTTGTLESLDLFKLKMTAGALYRAELSKILHEKLGLESELLDNNCFRLKGIPSKVINQFSSRRFEILKASKELGYRSQKALEVLTFATRSKKVLVKREELITAWKELAKNLKFEDKDIIKRFKKGVSREKGFDLEIVINVSVKLIKERESHFSFFELVKHMAQLSQGRAIGINDILASAKSYLETNPAIIKLSRVGDERYTTAFVLNEERALIKKVRSLSQEVRELVPSHITQKVIKEFKTLNHEQEVALNHITNTQGLIKAVSGMAGTGKSFLLNAVRESFELTGKDVLGLAPMGRTAKGLEASSLIKSETIDMALIKIQSGQLKITTNSVLIVDEAGLIGTKQMKKLVDIADKEKCLLVLVGDTLQLQPITRGAPQREIIKEIGDTKLKNIKRQNEDNSWTKNAILDFSVGKSRRALMEYIKRGQVFIGEDRADAVKLLINSWGELNNLSRNKSLIIASESQDVLSLNTKAQKLREELSELKGVSIKINDYSFYKNDRVLFTKNSKFYGVANGSLGTIKALNPITKTLTIKLDQGTSIRISLSKYSTLALGYAMTTHKSQGETCYNSYILASGGMQNRHLTYVQASRAKNKTYIFTDKLEAGDNFVNLVNAMSKDRTKEMAVSYQVAKPSFLRA